MKVKVSGTGSLVWLDLKVLMPFSQQQKAQKAQCVTWQKRRNLTTGDSFTMKEAKSG
jgi:hypothetical protein